MFLLLLRLFLLRKGLQNRTIQEMAVPRTIMVVDDEMITALNIKTLLSRSGYTATTVASGEECLRLLEEGTIPDLILMDINLGRDRIDGPETTRRIHQTWQIPVVLHSAYTDRETLQRTREMTKYGYIHKIPGNEEFLLASLDMAFKLVEREQMYRDLSDHITRAREEQNAFIAREIHDDLGQSISALKMNLTMLQRSSEVSQVQAITGEMRTILDATALKVRALIHELRPPVLDTSGILEALQWHVQEFSRAFGIPTRFDAESEEVHLGPDCSLAVFRIVQEALTNAARHGEPTKISVYAGLGADGENLVVTVRDNGKGFQPEGSARRTSFGLLNMRERAERCNGTFRLVSAPGAGTTVTISVPVADPGDSA